MVAVNSRSDGPAGRQAQILRRGWPSAPADAGRARGTGSTRRRRRCSCARGFQPTPEKLATRPAASSACSTARRAIRARPPRTCSRSGTCPSRRAGSRGPTRSSRGCGGTCWTTTALSRDAPVVFNLFYLTHRWSRRRRGGRRQCRARAVAVRAPTRFRRRGTTRGAGTAGASRRAAGGPGPLRRRPTLRPECARSPPACTSRGFARRRRGGRAPGLRVPRLIARLTTRRLLHSA